MSTTKYVRPMNFGEMVRSAFRLYGKSFWPFWLIMLVFTFGFVWLFDKLFELFFPVAVYSIEIEPWWIAPMQILQIMLPAFFIAPAVLTISNVVLERPKKTLTSFLKGMSLGMIGKVFLYFSPILAVIIILKSLHQMINKSSELFQMFSDLALFYIDPWLQLLFITVLLIFTPVWIFYPMILLLEKKGVRESVSRTRTFISGQIGRLLQIQILSILLTALIFPVGDLYYTYTTTNKYQQYGPIFQDLASYVTEFGLIDGLSMFFQRLTGGLFFVLPIVFGFIITIYILHYYQVRAVKENFNEELLTQELGYQPIEEMMTV